LKTIEIRKKYRLKLPDAIIAASALANNHILITNNVADFDKIHKLKVIDPFRLDK
jgi:predicted nucleic acid-binding protein